MWNFSPGKFSEQLSKGEESKLMGDGAHLNVSLQTSHLRSGTPGGFPEGSGETLLLAKPKGQCLVGHGGEVLTGAVWGLACERGAVGPRLHISRSEHHSNE